MIIGAALALIGGLLRFIWPHVPTLAQWSPAFPINGAWMAFAASLAALAAYVIVSLLTSRQLFDLDALLHRESSTEDHDPAKTSSFWTNWQQRLGVSSEFTRGDRLLFYFQIGWTLFWFTAFVMGTAASLIWTIQDSYWAKWWEFNVGLSIVVAVITVIWFTWGGTRNLLELFSVLKAETPDLKDDGTVLEKKPVKEVALRP